MKFSVPHKGKNLIGTAEKIGDDLWVHMNGKTFAWSHPALPSTEDSASASSDKIVAPMPGKIIKIHCSRGDAVEKDQVLVVMEAMKMEYSLSIGVSGEVGDVRCAVGDQVEMGQPLVELKED